MYRMQILMQVGPMASRPDADKYRSAWDALKRIPQREGWLVSPTKAKPMRDQTALRHVTYPSSVELMAFSQC